jgi:hypothetical protein
LFADFSPAASFLPPTGLPPVACSGLEETEIRHIPTDKTVLQKWLKAGSIENAGASRRDQGMG